MNNLEMAMKLIDLIGVDQKQNEILKAAIKRLLADVDNVKTTEKAAVKAESKKAKPTVRKKPIDWPKAEACRKAGWDYAKIADELGCAYQTVYNHFNIKAGVQSA